MKKKPKNECKFTLFLFLTWTSILMIVFYYIIIDESQNKYKSLDKSNCLIKNQKQFYVNISGVKYPKFVPLYENRSLDFKCLNSSNTKKTILLWTKFKGLPLPLIDYKTGYVKPFESFNCPVTNCELTYDRNKLNQSDLVLFHLRNRIDYFPTRTRPNQRFVHIIFESPINCHLCTKYENVFNLSATYTLNSDFTSIYWSDAGLEWKENKSFDVNYDFFSNKTNFSAAIISNCDDTNLRMSYLNTLKNYIDLDLYGKCGQLKCDHNNCNHDEISNKYKFYFAFENSICTDYITEKFFYYLRYNIIVVVLGGGTNYSHYVPKSAYINALDFERPIDLANYLIYLGNNKTAYNEYFKWKRNVNIYDNNKIVNSGHLCEMCIQLHLEENVQHVKKKRLDDYKLENLFSMEKNCKNHLYKQLAKSLNKTESINLVRHSYLMSPE